MSLPVSIIIPSWNGREILKRCLPSVERALEAYDGGGEIVVVDDGSEDGTKEWAAEAHPSARVIRQTPNQGFAAAVNAGVSAARHGHVLLLNNDMRVEPHFLAPLLHPFETASGLFATTPRIVNRTFGGDESVTACRFRFGLMETVFPEREGAGPGTPGHEARSTDDVRAHGAVPANASSPQVEVLFACGGAAAIDRPSWEALGGLDPLFAPFYWEDVDLSWRARRRGWRVLHVPASVVHHEHSATIGLHFDRRQVRAIYERNRLLFHWKNLSSAGILARHLLWLPVRLARAIAGRPDFLRGFVMAVPRAPAALRGRRAARRGATVSDGAILERFRVDRAPERDTSTEQAPLDVLDSRR